MIKFMIKYNIMKNGKISFLAMIAIAFGANCANASECVGDNCDLGQPFVFNQTITSGNVTEMNDSYEYDGALMPIEPKQTMQQSMAYDIIVPEYKSCDFSVSSYCAYDYNCPFETAEECEIWYKKPIHKTTLMPRAPHFNDVRVDEILYAIFSNYDITANEPVMSPLLERYLILMRASKACCTEGILHKMRAKGADDGDIYKFLKDNANYFAIAERCMVMNDDEFEDSYSNGVTGQMAIEVRNACLCKNRQWFETLLQPFYDVYVRAPMFEDRPFVYMYNDDMLREVTVYINDEVHTTTGLLSACPR